MRELFTPPEQNPFRTIRDVIRILPSVFKFLWQVRPLLVVVSCMLMGVTAVIPAAIVYMTKVIIDGVVEVAAQGLDWTVLVLPLVGIFGLWLSRTVFDSVSSFIQQLLHEQTGIKAQRLIIDKAGLLDLAFYENPRFYDQLYHASQNFWQINQICWSTLSLLQQAFSLTAMASLLSILHPLAIVVLFVTVMPRILTVGYLARKEYQLEADWVRVNRLTEYFRRLLTTRESAKEVRSFNLTTYLVERFNHFIQRYLRANINLMVLSIKVNSGLDILAMSGLISIYAFAVYQAAHGDITVGSLAMVFQAAQQSQSMLGGLIMSSGGVYQNALFVTRFFEFLALDPSAVEGALAPTPDESKIKKVPKPIHEGFVFENVWFKYPASEQWVIQDISFAIQAGRKVALAGQNGAGKTTIIKLLSRLYDPTKGRILLDGIDLREFSPEEVRGRISIVFQDYFRYDFTAAENVGVGQVDNMDDRELVEAAAKKGGAHEVIQKLPQQYDTLLGKTLDEGIDLSGGEWQHLAIARSFMRDAEVLVLDEPTAALDAFREQHLYEAISELAENKTVVFISHRFSTVRMADEIIVIEDGKLREHGSHESLIELDGLYAAMFNTQADRYR